MKKIFYLSFFQQQLLLVPSEQQPLYLPLMVKNLWLLVLQKTGLL